MEEVKRKKITSLIAWLAKSLLLGVFFVTPILTGAIPQAQAATLYFSSLPAPASVGSTFSVTLYTSSPDTSVTAFSGLVNFPADQLEVTSLSKSESVITFWVQEPSFSNTSGTVSFEGVTPNPGYQGTAGKLLTVNFKVKAAGTSQLSYQSGSVLANDGYGTDVLTGTGTTSFTLVGSSETPPPAPVGPGAEPAPLEVSPLPPAPLITSVTHPDQAAWYSNNDPVFAWPLGDDTTGVSILLNQKPSSDPGNVSDGLIATKDYTNLSDGDWYFHVKLKNSFGWGAVTNYHFAIDTVSPAPFTFDFAAGSNENQAQPHLIFQATDALSGLDHYLIRVNGVEKDQVAAAALPEGKEYILPPLKVGQNVITITAVDQAGNSVSAEKTLNTTEVFVPPALPLNNWRVASTHALETAKTVIALTAIGLIILLILLAAFAFANVVIRGMVAWTRDFWRNHRNGTALMRRHLMRVRRSLLGDIVRLENSQGRSRLSPEQDRVLQQVIQNLYTLEQHVSEDIKKL